MLPQVINVILIFQKKRFLQKWYILLEGYQNLSLVFFMTASIEACIDWIELKGRRTTLWGKIFFLNSHEIASSEKVAWVL